MNEMTPLEPNNPRPIRDASGKFVKGNPGSAGRPRKEDTLISLIKDELEAIDPDSGLTNAQAITKCLFKLAKQANLKAIKEILDRVVGKPTQTVELGNADGPFLSAGLDLSALSTADLIKLVTIADKALPDDTSDPTNSS